MSLARRTDGLRLLNFCSQPFVIVPRKRVVEMKISYTHRKYRISYVRSAVVRSRRIDSSQNVRLVWYNLILHLI